MNKNANIFFRKLVGLILLAFVTLFSCHPKQEIILPELSDKELIKRGKYVVDMGACNDCHSPKVMTPTGPVPDTTRLLSGHPHDEPTPPIPLDNSWVHFSLGATSYVGPWGQSFAANLTPHETGIGNWSYEQFEKALRMGKYKGLDGSRDLLPPMPWQMYSHISNEDLYALFAYLKSLKPVNNLVPASIAPNDLK